MARAIILSLTSGLDALADGTLTEMDLNSAIFSLGCARDFALETGAKEILKTQAPYQKSKVMLGHVMKFTKYLEEAERDKRVVWRRTDDGGDVSPQTIQKKLSYVLDRSMLEPLNPNLPPVTENGFLKTAIERVNNKNGLQRVRVIA